MAFAMRLYDPDTGQKIFDNTKTYVRVIHHERAQGLFNGQWEIPSHVDQTKLMVWSQPYDDSGDDWVVPIGYHVYIHDGYVKWTPVSYNKNRTKCKPSAFIIVAAYG